MARPIDLAALLPARREPGSPGAAAALLGALALVGSLAGALAAAWAGFALGQPLSAWALAGGGAVAAALMVPASRRRGGLAGAAAALAFGAAVWAGALAAAPLRHDLSWDGQSYHQQAVIALARGWNPLGPPLPAQGFTGHAYADNMAKGTWILEASVYRATGRIEAAKAVNLVFLAAGLLAALAALLSVPSLPAPAAWAAALLAALDPVAVTQAYTFYVDGTVGSAFLAAAAFAGLGVVRRERAALAGAALATLLLANAKLTGVPYAVVLWATAAAAAAVFQGGRAALRTAGTGAAAVAVGCLCLGFNPYVTNALRFGHPFHPAAGPRAVDFVAPSRPPEFARENRVERLLRSTFAVTSNHLERGVRLKPPFVVRWEEGAATSGCDVRIGGFGPLFGGALLLAAAGLLLARLPAAVAAGLAGAALLATALATAEGWWARLAPQLWLVPIALAAAPLAAPARRLGRAAGVAALLVLSADVGLVLVNHVNRVGRTERALRRQLSELAAAPGTAEVRLRQFESAGVRLDEAGVRWRAVDALPCARPETLVGSFLVELCRGEADAAR